MAPIIQYYVLALLVLAAVVQESESWRRRRRSRQVPPARNCQVGQWSEFTACDHKCGYAGTQYRWRRKILVEQYGGSCRYDLIEHRSCNRNACQNGGINVFGRCICKVGFAGTCCNYDINECVAFKPCEQFCSNTVGGFICWCFHGFTNIGRKCELRQCLINGRPYRYGVINPANPCQMCDSSNKLAWTSNNALKCSDGNAYTRADHCVNGRCVGTPFTCLPCERYESDTCKVKPGYCTIVHNGRKTCFINRALRPGYPCQICDSSNKLAWTSNNALKCSDGNAYTRADHCVNGRCVGTPFMCLPCERYESDTCKVKPGYCTIVHNGKKTCFINRALRPGYPCQRCNTTTSTTAWSYQNNVSCDDSNACTRSDTCRNGQCVGTAFTCNAHCQTCNGCDCSQKRGFGFVSGNCTCKIAGKDYNHQQLNPANQCQWCDLNDAATKFSRIWTNRPCVPCNDSNACTKKDFCNKGKCVGQPYSCQSSYPSSSCIKTSVCLGDGRCKDIMRPAGTICRAAKDSCDQPQKCDGQSGSCPEHVRDTQFETCNVQLHDPSFVANIANEKALGRLVVPLSGIFYLWSFYF